jgi:tRNA(Ile)-lysidine synthase
MIVDVVRNFIRRYHLLRDKDTIVVGVSGGPDSMALLYLLYGLRDEFRLKLVVAHLDHMLRKNSSRDAAYVRSHAQKLNLPYATKQVNIRALAGGGSQEEAARDARISFLCCVASAAKATKIALGHTLDDQAETVLMRVIRGAGLYGLQAIVPKRSINGRVFIRPLINVRRRDIEKYLRAKKIKPRIDSSNALDIYARNRIRRELLPLLEKKYNRNIQTVLATMAMTAGGDYDYLSQAVSRYARRWGLRMPLQAFLKLHPALQRLLVRQAFCRLKGDLRVFTFQHTREIEDLAANRPAQSIVDLPKGISAVKRKTHLQFYRR